MIRQLKFSFIVLILILTCSSCLTWYQQNIEFYKNFEAGNFTEAKKIISKDKKTPKNRNKLLYYLNYGTVTFMLKEYDLSNNYFEEAYLIGENYSKNYLAEIGAALINPTVTPYKGEDFEHLLVHYYKALNFLKLGDREAALVECRRLNNKLSVYADRYTSKLKYKRDAAMHTLMGIIYEANYDYNNAFIAYRNAYEIYEEDYKELFGIEAPLQLKKDLLRAAYKVGFMDELQWYEDQLDMKYEEEDGDGTLIFLWHNGMGPIKDEWSVNFSSSCRGNSAFFIDDSGAEYSFSISDDERETLSNFNSFKIAIPRYIDRPEYFQSADIIWGNNFYKLNLIEDLNQVARQTLKQRMALELSKALLRVALKKAAEAAVKSENKGAGALLNVFNTLTEQADTRAWHTIPHSIYYARVPIDTGTQSVQFTTHAPGGDQSYDFIFDIKEGETKFHFFHSLQIGK